MPSVRQNAVAHLPEKDQVLAFGAQYYGVPMPGPARAGAWWKSLPQGSQAGDRARGRWCSGCRCWPVGRSTVLRANRLPLRWVAGSAASVGCGQARKAGAALGSLVGPWGTAIGGAIGAVAGAILGEKLGRAIPRWMGGSDPVAKCRADENWRIAHAGEIEEMRVGRPINPNDPSTYFYDPRYPKDAQGRPAKFQRDTGRVGFENRLELYKTAIGRGRGDYAEEDIQEREEMGIPSTIANYRKTIRQLQQVREEKPAYPGGPMMPAQISQAEYDQARWDARKHAVGEMMRNVHEVTLQPAMTMGSAEAYSAIANAQVGDSREALAQQFDKQLVESEKSVQLLERIATAVENKQKELQQPEVIHTQPASAPRQPVLTPRGSMNSRVPAF